LLTCKECRVNAMLTVDRRKISLMVIFFIDGVGGGPFPGQRFLDPYCRDDSLARWPLLHCDPQCYLDWGCITDFLKSRVEKLQARLGIEPTTLSSQSARVSLTTWLWLPHSHSFYWFICSSLYNMWTLHEIYIMNFVVMDR